MTVDIENLNNKLKEKLKSTGWYEPMRFFIHSGGLLDVLKKLVSEKKDGYSFAPVLKNIFKCFEECSYSDCKVIILNPSPYPFTGRDENNELTLLSDGLAFSCANTKYTHNYLKTLQDSWSQVSTGERNKDLTYLANQGVLLLNISLTTRIGDMTRHTDIWKPFIIYLLQYLNDYNRGLIFLFLGEDSSKFSPYISEHSNYVFKLPHPSFYIKNNENMPSEIWQNINDILLKNYNIKIQWLYNLTHSTTQVEQ